MFAGNKPWQSLIRSTSDAAVESGDPLAVDLSGQWSCAKHAPTTSSFAAQTGQVGEGHSSLRSNIGCFSTKQQKGPSDKTVWASGLRRWLKEPVRKGVGSNPTAVILQAPPTMKRRMEKIHLARIELATFNV